MSKQIEKMPEADLDWVQLRKDMDASSEGARSSESWGERLKRKFLGQPLVPIGMFATVCALGFGLRAFRRGDKKMSQQMMRARVIAQGFTITVAVATVMVASYQTSNKLEEPKKEEQKAT